MISIVLESKGHGKYYPITAYYSDLRDIALFNRLKGDDDDKTNKK